MIVESPARAETLSRVLRALQEDVAEIERLLAEARAGEARVRALVAEARALAGEPALIAACAWCRRVRERGAWIALEDFVRARSNAEFTHGICPACLEETSGGLHGRR